MSAFVPASRQAPPQGAAGAHVPALDGLRGLAAIIVVVSHLAEATGLGGSFFQKGGGQIGVMIFFALSGFLMAHVYFGTAFRPATVYRFAVARFARVVPLFLVIVLASFAVTALSGPGLPRAYLVDAGNIADHLLLRSGVSVLWTIPVEIRFYALFPIFWLLYRLEGRLAVATVAVLVAAYFTLPPGAMPVMKLGHYFLIGIGAWFAWQALSARLSEVRRRLVGNLGVGLAAAALLCLFPLPFEALFGHVPRMWWEPQIAAAIFVLLSSVGASPLAHRMLASRPFRFCGDISYALYLTHMLTIMNLEPVLAPREHPLPFFALTLSLALLQSALIYRIFERPTRFAIRSALVPGRNIRLVRMAASRLRRADHEPKDETGAPCRHLRSG
ncbi:acyltransferase [Aurantimonas sp. VKM B-3413]|uniref:acyltransferase family protein n=1 Tax=Aurantimonas sp. VKM B-3413 TaxID=2779401 RepID=UPI001E38F131|nr:acyltransferase [Aurantimonas sp. VKM B-3413]MCB8839384.1 acyltransferase [Aurantimonas sp. VKM B-3413]